MRYAWTAAAPLALLVCVPAALAQTDSRAATNAAPTNGIVAPRTPGGVSAGAVQNNQGRMDATVGSIDNHLLKQEKDRPRLPNQTPSPSQTLPGGTASGQAPH